MYVKPPTRRPSPTSESRRRSLILGLSLLACIVGCGCDIGSMSQPAVSRECSQLGAQCQFAEGQLGVCENIACESDVDPPCFRCVDQH